MPAARKSAPSKPVAKKAAPRAGTTKPSPKPRNPGQNDELGGLIRADQTALTRQGRKGAAADVANEYNTQMLPSARAYNRAKDNERGRAAATALGNQKRNAHRAAASVAANKPKPAGRGGAGRKY